MEIAESRRDFVTSRYDDMRDLFATKTTDKEVDTCSANCDETGEHGRERRRGEKSDGRAEARLGKQRRCTRMRIACVAETLCHYRRRRRRCCRQHLDVVVAVVVVLATMITVVIVVVRRRRETMLDDRAGQPV